MSARHCSGSNRRRSTNVAPSAIPNTKFEKPQAWNSGAPILITSPSCCGIRSSSEAGASSVSGVLVRDAPFGVPVVPEVRIVTRPVRLGGGSGESSPSSISSPRVGSDRDPSSCHTMKRWRFLPASSVSSSNSSS